VKPRSLPPRIEALLQEVAIAFDINFGDVLGGSLKSAVAARQIAMWIIRSSERQPSYPEIGRLFQRDHTTVIAAVRRIDRAVAARDFLGRTALRIRESWGR